ncbi:hypothetical protein PhCBS80983_g03622 [Powellomyces hirtus]|uniref:Uncharacterized protein n=1 Tax=Powellomyces hirtus TaxID=109895 RepID=A0A507E3L4_9FUNG|nr:hypothetical protein PhCBS80983_g03622 [Powellomyces hirtus]
MSRKRAASPSLSAETTTRRLRYCFFSNTVGACTPSTSDYYRLAAPAAGTAGLDAGFYEAINSVGLTEAWQQAQGTGEELWSCHAHYVWCLTQGKHRNDVCQFLFPDWEEPADRMEGTSSSNG